MTVFALFFGFLKISDRMAIVSEESELSNVPLNIEQLANIHISHIQLIIISCLPVPSL